MTDQTILPGDRATFNYAAIATPLTGYAEHTGQPVTIVRQAATTARGPLFQIEADDGWFGFAFASELQPQ